MSNTGTIKIALQIDDRGGVKVLQNVGKESSSAGTKGKKAFNDMDKGAKSFNQSVKMSTSTLLKMGAAAASAAAVYELTKLYNESIKAASALEEVSSKYAVVFQGQTDIVDKWALNLVDKYAMSTREAKKHLASVQDLLVPMGMQEKAAAELSNEMVKLAGDLGSFNDLPTQQVIENIQSALVGEYETMKKYGVVINAAKVQQEALNMGLANTKEALTAADKAQAAYKLIVESSKAAIGDMERTSDGYANTTKRLTARWEDFTAALGDKFIEPATKAKNVLADILDIMTKMMQAPPLDQRLNTIADSIEKQIKMLERLGGSNIKNTKQYAALLANLQSIRDVQEDTYTDTGKWNDGLMVVNTTLNKTDDKLEKILQKSLEIKDRWSGAYNIDYGTDDVQAAIDTMLTKRNNEALLLERNIDLQNRMSEALEDTYDLDYGKVTDGMYEIEKAGESTADAWKNAFDGWASDFSGTLNDMLWGAETTFADIATSFGKMLTQMVIQKEIMEPALKLFSGGGSGGGFDLGGILKGIGGVFTGASDVPAYEPGPFDFSMAGGGVINEHVVGLGLATGKSYQFGESGSEVVIPGMGKNQGENNSQGSSTTNIFIYANDAKSFDDMIRRNPGSIISIVSDNISESGSLRHVIGATL